MNKKSIIFIVIAIVLVIVGFSSTNTSKQTDVISKAVYVEDGKVLPENDGKIVIVSGEVKAVTPLVDKLTGVELPGIKAKRNVERYQIEYETKDDCFFQIRVCALYRSRLCGYFDVFCTPLCGLSGVY